MQIMAEGDPGAEAEQDTRIRVLLVDDDEAIRETLRLILEEEGYAVIEAPDGVVALDVLRALTYPVVVISNHNMPRLDGPGLFNFILADPALAARHVYLYMTAGNRVIPPTFASQLEELNAPVLRKPFDLDTFLAAVAQAAERLRASQGTAESATPDAQS
jgi:CheY-like chemotaxis protein